MIIIGLLCIGCLIYSLIVGAGVAAGATFSHINKKENKLPRHTQTINRQTARIKHENVVKENILLHRKLRRIQNQNK